MSSTSRDASAANRGQHGGRRPQLSIRTALVSMVFIAIVIGWYTSMRRGNEVISRLRREVSTARSEVTMERARRVYEGQKPEHPTGGVLSGARLNHLDLQSASIEGGQSAFRQTDFSHSDLRHASLKGLNGAFQSANFDHSNLAHAKLSGGAAAFQLASFFEADLSGAHLTGGGASFQGVSLQGARLIGTTFAMGGGAFQSVNIDGAQFQGADLASLSGRSLAHCYFSTPPSYDEATRFPEGFDPVEQRWRFAEMASSRSDNGPPSKQTATQQPDDDGSE